MLRPVLVGLSLGDGPAELPVALAVAHAEPPGKPRLPRPAGRQPDGEGNGQEEDKLSPSGMRTFHAVHA